MAKSFRNLDDLPLDIRDNILGVIAANHIDFDPTKMTGGVKDIFNFWVSEDPNGRLAYNGDTYDSTYRLPDYKGLGVYACQSIRGSGTIKCLSLDFYDKNIGHSDYIYMEIDKRKRS